MSMKHIAFAIPGDIETPTGGYIYDRRIIAGLRDLGWQVDLIGLGDGFPNPDAATLVHAHETLNKVPASCPIVIDGLAYAVMPDIMHQVALTHPLIALVHHPLALESGLSQAQSVAFKLSEIAALKHAKHVIVTSPTTARTLVSEFDVAATCISAVLPGTQRVMGARSSTSGVIRLLAVGSVVPRKGFDVLMPALAQLKDLPWQLVIAGDCSRDPHAPAQLMHDLERFGLTDRIRVCGAVSAEVLESLYLNADVFVLASRYEGYGMAFAEALAHGLPVIATTGGAIPDTVPESAGILVEPGNVDQLAQALKRIITDDTLRAMLSAGAVAVAQSQPNWSDSAWLFSETLHAILD